MREAFLEIYGEIFVIYTSDRGIEILEELLERNFNVIEPPLLKPDVN